MKNDKPQFTLHKLPEGFIITSDEKIFQDDLIFRENELTEANDEWCGETHNEWRKVIAQQDQIDFSSLSPEIQKEIGYFDAELYYPRLDVTTHEDTINIYRREGFQKALELLSDRTFSSKDIRKAFQAGEARWGTEGLIDTEPSEDEYVQSISQSSWKVELEHVCEGVKREGESCSKNNNCSYPNCGKVKIIKLI